MSHGWTGIGKPYQGSLGILSGLGFTALIFVLTWIYQPSLWNRAFFIYASVVYLATMFARYAVFRWTGGDASSSASGQPDRLLGLKWYASFSLDILYCVFVILATGGDHSPFMLLVALFALHFASQRLSVTEALAAGSMVTVLMLALIFALYGLSTDVLRRVTVILALLWLLFLGTVVVMRMLVGQRQALELAHEETKKLNERLATLAFTDSLTGLCNHRQFHSYLESELRKADAGADSTPVALILADIDSFKHYNGRWGHTAGDAVLRQVAEVFLETAPPMAVVARYGGQQFAVILPGIDAREAVALAEQLRTAVARFPFEHRELQPGGEITISLGVAVFPNNAAAKNELLRKADDALYRAKERHKNTVQLYFSVLDDLNEDLGSQDAQAIGIVRTLIALVNVRDGYTYGHSERVAEYAEVIASGMNLGEHLVKLVRYAGILHDVGKIEVPKEILMKPTSLTNEEREVIERHPVYGAKIIEPVRGLKDVIAIVRHHHERFDGKGYPGKLRGDGIPLAARVLAVADSFDAMRADRPYRNGLPLDDAIAELQRNAGTQFDPEVVDVLARALKYQDQAPRRDRQRTNEGMEAKTATTAAVANSIQ